MKQVTVVAAQGVVLRGPMLLGLTPQQAAPRAHILQPQKGKKGAFLLDGGRETSFKAGEVIAIDDTKKLSPLQFAWDDDEEDVPDSAARAGGDAGAGSGTATP